MKKLFEFICIFQIIFIALYMRRYFLILTSPLWISVCLVLLLVNFVAEKIAEASDWLYERITTLLEF